MRGHERISPGKTQRPGCRTSEGLRIVGQALGLPLRTMQLEGGHSRLRNAAPDRARGVMSGGFTTAHGFLFLTNLIN